MHHNLSAAIFLHEIFQQELSENIQSSCLSWTSTDCNERKKGASQIILQVKGDFHVINFGSIHAYHRFINQRILNTTVIRINSRVGLIERFAKEGANARGDVFKRDTKSKLDLFRRVTT